VGYIPEKSGLLSRIPIDDASNGATESTRLEEELLSVIGHDLRSPLSVVLMTADALARTASDDASHAMARRLRSAGARIHRTIDELVDLGRVRRGEPLPLELVSTDVAEIAGSVVADLAAAHPARVTFASDGSDSTADVDLARVTRAVESVVVWALRQTAKKDCITVTCAEETGGIVICVRRPDVVDDAALAHVFDAFGTTADGRVRSDGTGLGMFLARETARAHGGSCEAVSAVTDAESSRAETVVRLRLPRRRA
jgi:signal transduction histidine kinase